MANLLRLGSTGPGVERVKRALNLILTTPPLLAPNRNFDSQTETRVRDFQRINGLEIDGVVGEFTHATLFQTNFSYSTAKPPSVLQRNLWWCWAAALESWLSVTPGRNNVSQRTLLNQFQQIPSALTTQGGLTTPLGIQQLVNTFRIDYQMMAGSALRAEFVYTQLKRRGHVLLIYSLGGAAAHAVVIYGVRIQSGQLPDFLAMDPQSGFSPISLGRIQLAAAVFVGWRR